MSKVEILAPVGSKESLVAAIKGGANAVYLGGKSFGARATAQNFSNEEIIDAIKYAHLHDVKVYVTVNILIFSDEMNDALAYVKFLYENYVDGIIVQDIGLLYLASVMFPNLKLVASTQMNVHNIWQAKLLKEIGVERIVVAREITYEQIKKIKNEVDIEIETFGHGALCVSFSGNCLMSSFIGGRSGNRGKCAQPCRLPYELSGEQGFKSETKYWMSPRDLMTIIEMDKIYDSQVDSLKIEGRLKSKEYVYASSNIYQSKIKDYEENYRVSLSKEEEETLSVLFSRGWTPGYINNTKSYDLINEHRPNHQGIEIGKVVSYNYGKVKIELSNTLTINDGIRIVDNDDEVGFIVTRIYQNSNLVNKANSMDIVELDLNKPIGNGAKVLKTFDYERVSVINEKIEAPLKNRPVRMNFIAFINDYPSLTMIDEKSGYDVTVIGNELGEVARSGGLTEERVIEQLSKTGETPFYLSGSQITLDTNLYLRIGAINYLRSEAINKLMNLINKGEKKVEFKEMPSFSFIGCDDSININVKVHTIDQLKVAIEEGITTIYYDDLLTLHDALKFKDKANIIPVLNRVNYELNEDLSESSYLVNEIGSLYKYEKAKYLIGDTYLNVVNEYSLAFLYQLGLKRITLSLEISGERIKNLISNFNQFTNSKANVEMIVYGRADLMYTKNCPITNATGVKKDHCLKCSEDDYVLVDRKGYEFPIIGNVKTCHVRILNSRRINLINQVEELKLYGVNNLRLEFTIEKEDETRLIIIEFKKAIRGYEHNLKLNDVTYGHYFNKIE